MSQPAQKRAVAAHPSEAEDTGRFAIDESMRATVLPARGDDADLVSLEDVGAIMELEADPITEVVSSAALPRGIVSGVFSAHPQPSAPPPVPADLRPRLQSERARLVIEDLSLQPGNPYAASSLVPPPRRPVSVAKVSGIACAVILSGIGAWTLTQSLTAEPQLQARTPADRPAAGAAVRAPDRATAAPPATSHVPASHVDAKAEPASQATAVLMPQAELAQPVQVAPRATSRDRTGEISTPAATTATPATTPAPAGTSASAAVETEPVIASATADEASPTPAATSPEDAAAALAALPQTPTREQVVAGFEAVQEQLVQCAAGKHGIAQIDATIASSGRISYALVGGKFTGSPEGSCMARVVRTARFPQFRQPTLKVSYPVAL
jgi:hypothetical protein